MQELAAILVEPEGVDHVLITHAHADQPLVHCFHFPFPGLGYIRERDDGYRWEPLSRGDFDPD